MMCEMRIIPLGFTKRHCSMAVSQSFEWSTAMIIRRRETLASSSAVCDWKTHYRKYVNPTLMTQLLRKSVPVLDELGWRVLEVREGYASSMLPLVRETTNQHGTHQAALIALSADYTGGLALASLLTGVPLAGIHPCHEEESASLWLADMAVRFRSPSTGHLIGECQIPSELKEKIISRYFSGKRVFVTLPVTFHSHGEIVAEAEMKYFAQPSILLRPSADSTNISPIFRTKLKASARMIAGVRAHMPNHERIRIDCPHTRRAASEHGHLLAARLRRELPQLTDMVHARTQHGDDTLRSIPGLKQVVLLGAGLDMRPYRLSEELPNVTWFELDLPVMLEERQRVISEFPSPPTVQRRPIGMDLLNSRMAELLTSHPDFDAEQPTLIIYEGCSMYFDADANRTILDDCKSILKNPASRLWCDMVTRAVVDGNSANPNVENFLKGMEDLGERFIFGEDHPRAFLLACGYEAVEVTSAAEYLDSTDTVFDLYHFNVAR